MLDQEQIDAPQFTESPRQAPRLDNIELAVPRAAVVMTPLAFGAAMMRMAHQRQQKWTVLGSAAQRRKAKV